MHPHRAFIALAPFAAGLALLTGCGAPPQAAPTITGHENVKPANAKEQAGPAPRLVLTTDQGLLTLDAKTLQPVAERVMQPPERGTRSIGRGSHLPLAETTVRR